MGYTPLPRELEGEIGAIILQGAHKDTSHPISIASDVVRLCLMDAMCFVTKESSRWACVTSPEMANIPDQENSKEHMTISVSQYGE